MCGLFAVFSRRGPIDAERFRRATDTLAHRGPDASGTHLFRIATPRGEVHAGFGHRRLSILDLSARSNQPFADDAGVLSYNGEIYNFAGIRARLGGPDAFRTTGDTEILHRLLSLHGDAGLPMLNGMWAFCFYDTRTRRLIASRDRYGKKPLFYFIDDTILCIASEAKAILHYLGLPARMRRDQTASFLGYGMCYPSAGGEAFFENIRQVPPGATVELAVDEWRAVQRPWFDFEAAARGGAPDDLGERVETAVLSRLVSDRPVGLLLSGGIDSSLILSVIAARGLQDQVKCFIGETGLSDDAAFARRCAAAAGVEPVIFECDYGPEAFDRVIGMCRHHEKPFPLIGNAVAMHEMYARIADHGIPVVLDGTGGDEVFGGYWDRYFGFAVRDAMDNGDLDWLADSLQAARDDPEVAAVVRHTLPRLLRRHVAEVHGQARTFGRDPVLQAAFNDPLIGYEGDLTGALVTDAVRGRLPEWIWHNDRNAMAFGIENRSPFLDAALIPAMGAGYAAKFSGPWNKISLRRLFSAFVPMPTQWRRQKQGFRWTAGTFLTRNGDRVLAMIEASAVLRDYIDTDAYVAAARRDERVLCGELAPRLLAVAGLERAFQA